MILERAPPPGRSPRRPSPGVADGIGLGHLSGLRDAGDPLKRGHRRLFPGGTPPAWTMQPPTVISRAAHA